MLFPNPNPNQTTPPRCVRHPMHLIGPGGCPMCNKVHKEGEEGYRTWHIMQRLRGEILPLAVSPGELFDRLTILWLKLEKVTCDEKRAAVRRESEAIESYVLREPTSDDSAAVEEDPLKCLPFHETIGALYATNRKLWEIEDDIRALDAKVFPLEQHGNRDWLGDDLETYLNLARSVYVTNDLRSKLKAEINKACGHDSEVKQYLEYKT